MKIKISKLSEDGGLIVSVNGEEHIVEFLPVEIEIKKEEEDENGRD